MIIYFSGTGNSRYCAQLLAAKLNDEYIDAAAYIKNGCSANFVSDKPWVFVSPVYGWQIPHIFSSFIRSANFSGSKRAYFVITCGSDTGNASKYISLLCDEKGLDYCGALEVVMPENYLAMFPVPNESKSKKIIAAARPRLESAAELISEGKVFAARRYRPFDNLKSGFINSYFYRHTIKASPFRITDKCTGCGKCVLLCPLNNISLAGDKPTWGNDCTHCMACICHCPTEAIEYGKRSVGKRRYLCPEYKGASST